MGRTNGGSAWGSNFANKNKTYKKTIKKLIKETFVEWEDIFIDSEEQKLIVFFILLRLHMS